MQKKQILFKTKGMNRDLSVSTFNPEFSFENMNLRLSTNESNTLLSWVNERGTSPMLNTEEKAISIPGIPIGTAVLNHKLIVFIAADESSPDSADCIYEFQIASEENHTLTSKLLYSGNLNFSAKYPIETLTSYESTEAQKIYWTDFNNQPRVINIAKYEVQPREYTATDIDTVFDFVASIILKEQVTVTKNPQGSGTFAPGVIQYCLAYFNKYGQQTNIIYASPLCYLSHVDRGASSEEKVSCSFTIRVDDIDENFDYLRLYSVQRTSLDADPVARIISDLKVANAATDNVTGKKYLTFTDSGIYGTSITPTELLYIGGKPIKALTMTEKDQTLFLGNIKQESLDISKIQDYFYSNNNTPEFGLTKECSLEDIGTFYPYKNSLGGNNNNEQITTFKGGDYYRFGIQLQRKTGEWSEPIYLGDRQNDVYPQISPILSEKTYQLSQASKAISFSDLERDAEISLEDYVRVRPLVVFPSVADRSVICQGVLNPTVFNAVDRANKYIFSQPSWFFRPYTDDAEPSGYGDNVKIAANAAYTHYSCLPSQGTISIYTDGTRPSQSGIVDVARNIEIQGSYNKYVGTSQGKTYPTVWGKDNGANTNSQYFVDQSIVTLNSPEIDFDTSIQTMDFGGLKLRVVGYIDVDSSASSHIITTSSNKSLTGQNLTYDDHEDQPVQHISGEGETLINVLYNVGEGKEKGSRMIAGNIWNDGFSLNANVENLHYSINSDDPIKRGWSVYETEGDGDIYTTHAWPVNFFIHPWHASRSLNNDWGAGGQRHSVLETKRMANLLYSYKTCYLKDAGYGYIYKDINAKVHLQENEQVYKIGIPTQKSGNIDISYYPNIDKVLYNQEEGGYIPLYETSSEVSGKRYNLTNDDDGDGMLVGVSDAVEMKYKSASHAVIALNERSSGEVSSGSISLLPYLRINTGSGSLNYKDYGRYYINPPENNYTPGESFWGDTGLFFYQPEVTLKGYGSDKTYDWDNKRPKILWLGELYRELSSDNLFGGNTKEAIKNNIWLIGGEAVNINREGDTTLVWNQGDTYYQRYDCLKTYPFTTEDKNQMIEILSFMCETHVNLDGRYDANRGHTNNVNVNPQNFNLINSVYSQLNNFFTSRQISSESTKPDYPNVITYSMTKSSASDVDAWTNVTLASTLELDGSKGQITSLNRFNDQIIAFQDKAISQVLYNENVQISSTQGVPIEIVNSGKVQGKRYLNDFIGCSNKWSITHTPAGIYFTDSNNKGIYMFDGAVKNLSGTLGFNVWCKNNIPNSQRIWNPKTFDSFVSYYDAQNQDVLFINSETCLAYSEKFGTFTSFYNYENAPYFCNLDDAGIWVKPAIEDGVVNTRLYHHQTGIYGKFFGVDKPYGMTIVGNPEPQMDKIFTNLEFRASVEGDGELNNETGKFTPTLPFDSLETWNEYQHGYTTLENKNGYSQFTHHTPDMESSLKRKFRIWRCDIPRDNYEFKTQPVMPKYPTPEDYQRMAEYQEWCAAETAKGIFRYSRKPQDRMRNPWLYLKLWKEDGTNRKTEIHDVVMTYFD